MTQPSTRIPVSCAGYAELLFPMRLAGKVARQHAQIDHFERHWPGLFVWPGKRHYETAQRRKQAQDPQIAMHLHHI